MRAAAPALGALLAIGAMAAPARAQETPARRYGFELAAYGGIDKMITGKGDHIHEIRAQNGGGALAARLLFRAPYFLAPFFDFGYYPLFAADQRPPIGRARAASKLYAYGAMWGPAFDFWRLRIAAGVGVYNVHTRSTLLGDTIRTQEVDIGYMFTLSGFFVDTAQVRLGTELRAGLTAEADIYFVSYGLTVTGRHMFW